MTDGEQPSDPPALRASDAERERAATLLRDHAGAGRLTPEELDERLDVAYAALTVSQLDTLLRDLPAPGAASASKPPARSEHREITRRRLVHAVGQALLVTAAAIAIWLATGADGDFWPRWVVLVMVIRIAFRTWGELGPGGRAERRHHRDEARLGRGGARPRELPREQADDR